MDRLQQLLGSPDVSEAGGRCVVLINNEFEEDTDEFTLC